MSVNDREAVTIYLRIKNLAALGGTDYSNNLKQLMIDSIAWQKRAKHELEAIAVWITLQNAINDGASVSSSPNTLYIAAKCLVAKCLGKEQMNGIAAYLGCSINTLTKPD